jgi:hypothetical protein
MTAKLARLVAFSERNETGKAPSEREQKLWEEAEHYKAESE